VACVLDIPALTSPNASFCNAVVRDMPLTNNSLTWRLSYSAELTSSAQIRATK
jgi:hypothetical protein